MGVKTRDALINWGRGDANSVYLAQGLLGIDGATEVDVVHPQGGPDNKKDILCTYNGVKCVGAVYFPNNSGGIKFSAVKKKFESDLVGVRMNGRQGFLFITNVHITSNERETLEQMAAAAGCAVCVIYHLERVHHLLDKPLGYGLRHEYLGIELSPAEEISYREESRLQDRKWMEQKLAHQKQNIEDSIKQLIAQALNPGSGSRGQQ